MKKTIDDPSSLLRRLDRAPIHKELFETRMVEINKENVGVFMAPSSFAISPTGLATPLMKVLQRAMLPKEKMDLPLAGIASYKLRTYNS